MEHDITQTPILSRTLKLDLGGEQNCDVFIEISRPFPDKNFTDEALFYCNLFIKGEGINIAERCSSIDEIATIVEAFSAIRRYLDPLGNRISFLGQKGYTGIPKMISSSFGQEFLRNTEKIIDDEFEKLQATLTERRLAYEKRLGRGNTD